jgi:hypothetical protein
MKSVLIPFKTALLIHSTPEEYKFLNPFQVFEEMAVEPNFRRFSITVFVSVFLSYGENSRKISLPAMQNTSSNGVSQGDRNSVINLLYFIRCCFLVYVHVLQADRVDENRRYEHSR